MTIIKERGILFSAPMVRALLDGRKTVTRRAVKGVALDWLEEFEPSYVADPENGMCPYGKPGDRLWVRETWARVGNGDPGYLTFRATYPDCLPPDLENVPAAEAIRWKPSIHMFRRDSRILLEITDVRVERLQDISEEQAEAEGAAPAWLDENDDDTVHAAAPPTYRRGFARLWRDINGAGAWGADPWVWVVAFRQITR
jgi:hypothetical protein